MEASGWCRGKHSGRWGEGVSLGVRPPPPQPSPTEGGGRRFNWYWSAWVGPGMPLAGVFETWADADLFGAVWRVRAMAGRGEGQTGRPSSCQIWWTRSQPGTSVAWKPCTLPVAMRL